MRSGGGRFESGGSEAGTGAGVSGGYGAALGGRPSLEDVSPPGAGERHHDSGFSALQVVPLAVGPGLCKREQFPPRPVGHEDPLLCGGALAVAVCTQSRRFIALQVRPIAPTCTVRARYACSVPMKEYLRDAPASCGVKG